MSTGHQKCLDLLVKVDRAYKHIIDFEKAVQRFMGPPEPYEVIPKTTLPEILRKPPTR